MAIRTSLELVDISTVERMCRGTGVSRYFTPREIKRNPRKIGYVSLAGVYAAKRAVFRALGARVRYLDIEIEKALSGRPGVRFLSRSLKKAASSLSVSLSISHTHTVAVAFCVVYDKESDG